VTTLIPLPDVPAQKRAGEMTGAAMASLAT